MADVLNLLPSRHKCGGKDIHECGIGRFLPFAATSAEIPCEEIFLHPRYEPWQNTRHPRPPSWIWGHTCFITTMSLSRILIPTLIENERAENCLKIRVSQIKRRRITTELRCFSQPPTTYCYSKTSLIAYRRETDFICNKWGYEIRVYHTVKMWNVYDVCNVSPVISD